MGGPVMDRCLSRRGQLWAAVLLLAGLLGMGSAAPAHAQLAGLLDLSCHAVTAVPATIEAPEPRFSCSGKPNDYQRASLWFRFVPNSSHDRPVVLVHNSRFDRLVVSFHYADGAVRRQHVASGDFGAHWRPGGQIAFTAPDRDAGLAYMTLRFDRPASADLLRIRLVDEGEASWQATVLSGSIGAALMLLAIGAIYNLSLALVTRRQFPLWQGLWDICMVVWGGIWSQFALTLDPALAGATSAQLCTALACGAVMFATFAAITAIEREYMPLLLRRATLLLGLGIGVLGFPLAALRSGPLLSLAIVLGWMILADLLLIASVLAIAWRRGSSDARAYAGAWAVPMLTLGTLQFIDVDALFWGAGSQIVVLMAAAWQTLWLSVAASRSHGRLRAERDMARSAEARAHELARRDPLTGLANRRGFVEAAAPMIARANRGEGPVALLLIDIDRFKQVNDAFGHDAGDAVLCTVARRLQRWEGAMCTVARLGGEEFALMIGGLEGFVLARFAENLRKEIGACRHDEAIGDHRVTVSVGVAEAARGADFHTLYRHADEALYFAKREGRDRVGNAAALFRVAGRGDRAVVPATPGLHPGEEAPDMPANDSFAQATGAGT